MFVTTYTALHCISDRLSFIMNMNSLEMIAFKRLYLALLEQIKCIKISLENSRLIRGAIQNRGSSSFKHKDRCKT